MKTKKFNKKLSLNKKTVSNLNQGDMGDVRGGNLTGVTCAPRTLCLTEEFSCVETMCQTCFQSCHFTDCYSECIC